MRDEDHSTFLFDAAIVVLFSLVASNLVRISRPRSHLTSSSSSSLNDLCDGDANDDEILEKHVRSEEDDMFRGLFTKNSSSANKTTAVQHQEQRHRHDEVEEDDENMSAARPRRQSLLEKWEQQPPSTIATTTFSPSTTASTSATTMTLQSGGEEEEEEERQHIHALLAVQRAEIERLLRELEAVTAKLELSDAALAAKTREAEEAAKHTQRGIGDVEDLEFHMTRLEKEIEGVREEYTRLHTKMEALTEERNRLEAALKATDGEQLTLARRRGDALEQINRPGPHEAKTIERVVELGTGSEGSARMYATILYEAMKARRIRDDDAMADSLLGSLRALAEKAGLEPKDMPLLEGEAERRLRGDMQYFVHTLATEEGLGHSAKTMEVARLVREFDTVDSLRAATAAREEGEMRDLARRVREEVVPVSPLKYASLLRDAEEALCMLSARDALETAVRSGNAKEAAERLSGYDFWYWGEEIVEPSSRDDDDGEATTLPLKRGGREGEMRLMGSALDLIYRDGAKLRLREARRQGEEERALALRLAAAEGLNELNSPDYRLLATEYFLGLLRSAHDEESLERVMLGDDEGFLASIIPESVREKCRFDTSVAPPPLARDSGGTGEESKLLEDVREEARSAFSRLLMLRHTRLLQPFAFASGGMSTEEVETALKLISTARGLVRLGWMSDFPALSAAERRVRIVVATRELASTLARVRRNGEGEDETRRAVSLSCALDVADEVGARSESTETFEEAAAFHRTQLDKVLERAGIREPDVRAAVLGMGVEAAEDLALLTEGDLRQAGVSRVGARRVLPALVALGTRAAEEAVAARQSFETRVC